MSILNTLRNTRASLREGLEKLGIALPNARPEDDEDTADQSILDIYHQISSRHEPPARTNALEPIPDTLKHSLQLEAQSLTGQNQNALNTVQTWLDARPNVIPLSAHIFPDDVPPSLTPQTAIDELYHILVHQKCLLPCRETQHPLATFQAIAATTQRPIQNLLKQANRQIPTSTSPGDWHEAMNQRLARFNVQLVCIQHGTIPLAGIRTLHLT